MKKHCLFFIIAIILTFLTLNGTVGAFEEEMLHVVLNGQYAPHVQQPIILEGKIYLPLEIILSNIKESIHWDEANRVLMIGHYPREETAKNTYEVKEEALGYSLFFPNDWKDRTILKNEKGVLTVYEKTSHEAWKEQGGIDAGRVFSIRLTKTPAFVIVPCIELDLLDGQYLEVVFASDVQYTEETKEAYAQIRKESIEVLKTYRRNRE